MAERAIAVNPQPQLVGMPRPSTRRMASLDGLRALAIGLVLLAHLRATRGFGNPQFGIGDYGHLGVVVFFVISGFLITSLLLAEHARRGRVSLKLFYARRSLRIFPASYAYVAIALALTALGLIHLTGSDLWHAATYTVNYHPGRSWPIGHLWSLAVEEQFYLLWPFAFVMLGPRRAVWAVIAVIALGPAARAFNRWFLISTPYHDLEMFPMVADSLAMGCLLAILRGRLEQQRWYLKLFRPVWSLPMVVLVLLINRYRGYTAVDVLGLSVLNVCLAVLIHRAIYHPADRMGRFLNWKPVAFAGVLSYSLYLWQQPFLNRSSDAWMNAFPQNLIFAIGAALLSYLLLERPLQRLRSRFCV